MARECSILDPGSADTLYFIKRKRSLNGERNEQLSVSIPGNRRQSQLVGSAASAAPYDDPAVNGTHSSSIEDTVG